MKHSSSTANVSSRSQAKLTPAALRGSEERYRALYDDNPSMYFTVDPRGTVLSVNRFGAEQLGYTVAELVGQSVLMVFHEEDKAVVSRQLATCLAQPNVVHRWEVRKVRKDGTELWVKETARGIETPDRKPIVLVVCEDITARRRAEEALRLMVDGTSLTVGADFFRSLVRHLACALSVRFAFVAELGGNDKQQVRLVALWTGTGLGENFAYALRDTPCERVFADDLAYFPTGVCKLFPKDRWLLETGIESYLAVPMYDPTGNPIGHLGVMHDAPIRDDLPRESILRIFAARAGAELVRKKVEEALRESEKRFRNYFKLQSIGMAITLPDKRWIEVNNKLCEILGYPREELLQKSWTELTHPDDLPANLDLFNRAIAGELDDFSLDKRFICKDGSVVHVNLSVRCMGRPDGKIDYFLVVYDDITDRKRAEEALRQSEYRLRKLFEQSNDAVFIHSLDGQILEVNDRACEMLGYDIDQLVAMRIPSLHPEQDHEAAKRSLKVTGEQGSVRFESRFSRANGTTIDVEISARVIDREKGIVQGIVRDITERKRAERKLRQYRDRLRTLASKMSLTEERERRRIAAELHDRTIQTLGLSKIKLGALRKSLSSSERATGLNEIQALIEQTIHDTRSLLFELSPPVLYELGFEPAIEWLAERHQELHGIVCEVQDDQQAKPLNKDLEVVLFQAVRELLANIGKHAEASRVKVILRKEGDSISIRVEDNGVGFDTSVIGPQSMKEGGFGLFSIRERLLLLTGHLAITSAPGKGTRVELTAPLKSETEG